MNPNELDTFEKFCFWAAGLISLSFGLGTPVFVALAVMEKHSFVFNYLPFVVIGGIALFLVLKTSKG